MRQVIAKRCGGSVLPSSRWAVARSAALAAAVAGILSSAVPPALAATVDWDITPGAVGLGNGSIQGGAGSWDTTLGNWTVDGGANNVAWVNANNDVAQFGGTGGTVGLTTGITAGGLTFNVNGYTVSGNTLTLAGTPTITVTNAADTATVSSVLAGNAGLTKDGAGKVIINGANTFTGNITLNGGTLETNMVGGAATSPLGGQIGTTYRQMTFNNNAVLRTTATWNDNTPTATNVGIQFNFAGDGTLDVSTGQLTIDDGSGAGTASTNSQLVGAGTLTKAGAGTLSLGNGTSNFDTFTGAIVVSVGTLQLGSGTNQFGTTANGTTVQSGAALNVQANTTAEPLTISGTGISNGGALFSSTGTAGAASGPITLAANSSVGGTGNLTLGGVVSGGFNLTKVGTGALILNGANTYTGSTTVSAGALRGAFGTGLPSSTNLVLSGGAYEPTANFTGTLGTGGSQVQLPGGTSGFSGGLAAGVTVNLDSGATLSWGSANFNPSSLLLNHLTAVGTVTLQNPIDLNGAARSFTGGATINLPGIVSGAITSTGGPVGVTINGPTGGGGVIQFTNTNNTGINAVTLTGGQLGISADGNIGGATTPITFDGGGLQILGTTLANFGTHPVTFVAGKNIQIDVNNAAHTFSFDASTPLLVAGQTLTKVGAGTLALAPAAINTVTTLNMNGGTLDLNGGTLNISNAGTTTIRGTANSTINNGTIVLSTAGGVNFADNSVANVTLTINAKVSGADNTAGFEYCCDNSGTIALTNPANDFQGNVFLNSAGTLSAPGIGVAGADGPLGKGNTITLAGLTGTAPNQTGARLLYTGPGETTDRVIAIGQIRGILDASGTTSAASPLKFTANLSVTNNAAKIITLQGTGFGELAGVIPNNTAATSITKSGAGTWVLSGTNTYTGTTTLAGGALSVSTAANLGATAAPLVFNGGTLRITGTTLNNLTGKTVTFTNNAAAGIDVADAANTFTLGGPVTIGTGDFTKAGPGTLVMTGANSVRTLNANGGTIELGSGTLTLNNTGNNTIRGTADTVINGGTITISMTGTTGTNFGDNSVSPGVTLTINSKLTFASGATTGFEYCCDDPGGTIALTNPANDFPGVIQINRPGTIAAPGIGNSGLPGPIGAGNQIVINTNTGTGGRFLYTGPGETTNRTVVLANTQSILDASGTTSAASPLRFTSDVSVTNNAAKTFTLQGTGFGELAGVVPNNTAATSVVKTGTGTWSLAAANTYTGTTTVNAGTLLASNTTGSATGTGAVNVTGTGTLGGSGTITGAVSIAAGTTGLGGPAISPGTSPGILSTGNLTLGAGSDAIFELLGTTPGTGHDQLNVTGAVSLGNADLIIASVGTLELGQQYTIINNDGADLPIGTFASGATVTGPGGSTFSIDYAGGDGNDVVLTTTAVPEPTVLGMLGLVGGGLLARRRRQR